MRRSMAWSTALTATTALLAAGCSYVSGGIAPSTKPLAPGGYQELGTVEAEDCQSRLLGLIPLSEGNQTKNALANAFEKALGADALVQVTVDTYTTFWILWSSTCTQVQGTAVSTR